MATIRTCRYCKNKFDIESNPFIKNGYSYYEDNSDNSCFDKMMSDKGFSDELIQKKKQELKKEYHKLQEQKREIELRKQQQKVQKDIKKEKTKIQNAYQKQKRKEDKENLIEYIKYQYNINFTKYLYIKLANIDNGCDKNIKQAIPYEHLLDMFKRKEHDLAKIRPKDGKFTNNTNKFLYHLAVIVSLYDGYLRYLNKQKRLQSDVGKKDDLDYKMPKKSKNKQNNKDTNDDLLDIIDEI